MSREWMDDFYAAQLRAAKAEGELARIKDALREFAEDNGFNPEMEPRDLLAKATGSFRSCSAMSDARYTEIQELKAEMEAMRPRLMPEGMEWPKVDGKPVDFKTAYGPSLGVLEAVSIYNTGACQVMSHDGIVKSAKDIHIVKPKVLDADGVEILEGDTVYLLPGDWCDKFPCLGYHGGEEVKVFSLHAAHVEGGIGCRDTRRPKGTCYPQPSQLTHRAPVIAADGKPLRERDIVFDTDTGEKLGVDAVSRGDVTCRRLERGGAVIHYSPEFLTHQRPVLDADGVPIREGDEVYGTVEGGPFIVTEVSDKGSVFVDAFPDTGMHGSMFTHTKPEPPDSWEQLKADIYKEIEMQQTLRTTKCGIELFVSNVVRRCKALAERGER